MALTVQCPEIPFATFSPKPMTILAGAGETSATTTFYTEAQATTIATIVSELFNNAAEIDISNIGRRLFTDSLVQVGTDTEAKVFLDHRRYTNFESHLSTWPEGFTHKYMAANAVLKPGVLESTYMSTWADQILTRASKLLWYPGYTDKSYIAIFVYPSEDDTILTFKRILSDVRLLNVDAIYSRIVIVDLNISGAQVTELEVSTTGIPTDNKDIVVMCIPNAPLYVRWMNDIAGVEHWMFSGKQEHSSEITDQVIFNKRVSTNQELASNSRLVGATRKDLITAGSQGVTLEDAEILNTLMFSPLIEFYDEVTSTWQKITIEEASVPIDKNEPTGNVSFTFKLPTRDIQTY